MESLVLFARAPVLGKVKTRLARELGDEAALRLYTAFLLDTADVCAAWRKQSVAADPNRRLILYAAPDAEDPILVEVARRTGARCVPQPEGDLGARLGAIFEQEFTRGARAVCAIGSDSPTLPQHLVEHAFRALQWERVVLGPSTDGGYWIVGAQRPAPDLFTDIPWSTDAVLERTLDRLAGEGVPGHLLPFWYDVDDETDVRTLVWHLKALRQQEPVCEATWQVLKDLGLTGRSR